MNKLTRGAIAAGVGVVLLLGGAGTFALWSDTATLSGSTITAGELKFGTVGSPQWTNVTNGGNTAIADISTFRIVPGNSVRLTQTVQITATGTSNTASCRSPQPRTGSVVPSSCLKVKV